MLHDHIPLIIALSFAAFGVLTALVFLGLAIASVALREAEAMASCEPPPESDVYIVSDKQPQETSPCTLRSCRTSEREQRAS